MRGRRRVGSAAGLLWLLGALATRSPSLASALDRDFSTVENKLPSVLAPVRKGSAVTAALSPAQRRAFEHLLGHALGETPGVKWMTREFAQRMRSFLVGGAALNGVSEDAALSAAFVTAKCDRTNTGYVGPSLPAIKQALQDGNIREVWGLMYVLTKTRYFTDLVLSLLAPAATAPAMTPDALGAAFGLDAPSLAVRWAEVQTTLRLPTQALRYSQGMPDFAWEPFSSWVRFDFDAVSTAGTTLWTAARVPLPTGCRRVGLRSDDPSIEPPLSEAELAYQCGGAAGAGDEEDEGGVEGSREKSRESRAGPCELKWEPGAQCFQLPNASWTLPDATGNTVTVPGINARAALLGYRSCAAASGTTANMLQLGTLLGFRADELVLLRATMAAWMMPTDDHSFFEILLGADTYVPEPFRMLMGLQDLRALWPPNATLTTADGRLGFSGADLWRAVSRRLHMAPQLLEAMAPEAQAYVKELILASTDGSEPPSGPCCTPTGAGCGRVSSAAS